MTSLNLKTYMVRLATDIDYLSDFVADPHKATEKAGLSPQDQAVLFSGDQSLIYTTLTTAPTSHSGPHARRKAEKQGK